MSDLVLGRRGAPRADPFRALTVALILLIGIFGFVGMLVMGAFAPDLRSGHNGGGHALSNSAIGFSGIVQLATATGRNGQVIRNEHQLDSEDLLVVTPDHGWDDLGPVLGNRNAKPTLVVFPKWETVADKDHEGWVKVAGLLMPFDPDHMFSPSVVFPVGRRRTGGQVMLQPTPDFSGGPAFRAPRVLQVITGVKPGENKKPPKLTPLLTDRHGGIVLAKYGDQPLYLLADPDLLSNAGIRDPRQAAAALAMLDWLNSTGATSIGFDVTMNGFGHSQSPLKLAFTPPFLAMTLTLAVVLALVGWHALGRFGPIRPRARAIAFGKAVLVENSAKLIRRAGRETDLGGRYVQVIRERAVATFGVPARLKDAALDAYLDKLSGRGAMRFSELARAAEATRDRASLVAAAQALHHWQKEKKG
ncbi:MAG TPA: hypothetical protein VK533_05760 [Sphingomonas sp.]|uniref:hypothetical protein n=1 Tax=Sphingomonas sp. TaxID=28214 RepID=UPI002C19B6DF|nr:hypothetical protein [Sphingomonas sp.]HMI19032.1 hypothetical protein [Sphingomonas sp.]